MPITIDKSAIRKSLINLSNDDDGNTEIIPFNDKNIEPIVENADDHLLISTKNKIPRRTSRKSKYYFPYILILFISALVLVTSFIVYRNHLSNQLKQSSKKCQQQTEVINQLTHLRSIDNQTIQQHTQELQQSIDKQNKLHRKIEQLTNQLNRTSTPTYQTNFHSFQLKSNLNWKQYAETIAGGNRYEDKLNQLCWPEGIYVDDQQQSIYIADWKNHRIVKWKLGENNGQIIAGGNGQGNRIDQLNYPTDVIVDQKNKSLIICDYRNRRVVRWSLENQQDKQIIIGNIKCWGLTMNENGDLFVSDQRKHEVKRWRKGEKERTIFAGGNGKGDQLNEPTLIFIDRQETVYVSDSLNHRVMKWMKGAKEGIVVAGGQGKGNSSKQLSCPNGLIVNEVGDVYVADWNNHRIMCWSSGSKEGRVVVGGNGRGQGSNQFNGVRGLSFDVENNLYVADHWNWNHRIQRFSVDKN